MQKMFAVCAGLVVFLGVVAGVLWGQLRTERQLVSEMREQMAQMQAKLSEPRPAPQLVPQVVVAASAPPAAAVKVAESAPRTAPIPMPVPAAAPPVPAAPTPRVNAAPAPTIEERRTVAFRAADEAATGRVHQWNDRLTQAGLSLTTEQLQALSTASISEHRREAEESLAQQRDINPPKDAEDAFRIREENLVRMNDTNLRILQVARPQLTEAQVNALRTQFERGHATRMEALRAERERFQQAGQAAR